ILRRTAAWIDQGRRHGDLPFLERRRAAVARLVSWLAAMHLFSFGIGMTDFGPCRDEKGSPTIRGVDWGTASPRQRSFLVGQCAMPLNSSCKPQVAVIDCRRANHRRAY